MSAFLALVRNDLVLFFSNRRALVLGVAVPIAIAAFMGTLFGRDDGTPSRVPVAVTDLDQSALSSQVIAALRGDGALDVRALPQDEALAQVRTGKATAALTLPAGFGDQAGNALFDNRQRPAIGLAYDPSQAMALQLVRGLLAQHVMQTVSQSVFSSGSSPFIASARDRALQSPTLAADARNDLVAMFDSIARVQQRAAPAASASGEPGASAPGGGLMTTLPYRLEEQEASAHPEVRYNSYAHAFAGMGVQFVLFTGIDLGIGLLALRRLDLWKRLRASPVSKPLLIGSRVASGTLTAVVLLACIYAAAIGAFGVRIDGSVVGFVGVVVAFAWMTAGFGLLIAALGRTPEATRPLAIFVTLLLVMVGGAWVPAFVFPAWLQQLSLGAPTRWAVDGLDAMTWRGLGLQDALAPIGVMAATGAVCAWVAVWRFDWEE